MVPKTTTWLKGDEFTVKKWKKYEKYGKRVCEKEYWNELLPFEFQQSSPIDIISPEYAAETNSYNVIHKQSASNDNGR